MEKVRYEEARSWFWTRTWIWFVPVAIASVVMCYFLPDQVFSQTLIQSEHFKNVISVGAGVVSALMGLLAARISMQTPWMHFGWRSAFVLNSVACAAMACLAALFAGGFVLSFMQNDLNNIPSATTLDTALSLVEFGAAMAAFWGMAFGTWFAVRRDRYFVQPI